MASVDDVDRTIVLGYASRIPWDRYIACVISGALPPRTRTPAPAPGACARRARSSVFPSVRVAGHQGGGGGGGGGGGSAGAATDASAENLYIDASSVALIKRCAALSPSALTELLRSGDPAAAAYPAALLQVLVNMKDVRIMQYTLTLMCDFLEVDVERRARAFLRGQAAPALTSLLQMVGTSSSGARIVSVKANPYVLEHAARAAALLLSVDPSDQAALTGMVAWVHTNLKLFGSTSPAQVKVTEVRGAVRPRFFFFFIPAQGHAAHRRHPHLHRHARTGRRGVPHDPPAQR